MPQVLWSVGLLVNFHLVAAASNNSPMPSTRPAPGCPSMCGDVEIPYPFGISDCAWPGPDNFTVTCDHSSNPPKLFFSNAEVTNISLVNGSMTVFTPVSSLCYTSSNTTDPGKGWYGLKLTNTSFLISATENVFTAIGCNRLALVYGKQDASYFAGCVISCRSLDTADLPYDGDTCSGVGCCQTTILSNLSTILVDWNYGNNGTTPNNPWWNYLPCMYAFVGQKDWYVRQLFMLVCLL